MIESNFSAGGLSTCDGNEAMSSLAGSSDGSGKSYYIK